MRVKVGDTWFRPGPGQPVMIELTQGERQQVSDMPPEYTRYAQFDESDGLTADQKQAWMQQDDGE